VYVQKSGNWIRIKLLKEFNQNDPILSYDMMELTVEAEDQNMKSGSFAFFTNSTGGALFDKFSIDPIECNNTINAFSDWTFKPEECNRFRENYKGGPLELRWNVLDPMDLMDGPSNWFVDKN